MRVAYENKDLFANPLRKNIWVVHNKRAPVSKACSFRKNPQTTGIAAFSWDESRHAFTERDRLHEQFEQRLELREYYASSIKEFNGQEWSGIEYAMLSRGQSDSLESPMLHLPPVIFSTFSFSLKTEYDSVAHFLWQTDDQSSFHADQTFFIPIKAGEYTYSIPLDTCPDWFLNTSIQKLKLIPTEKSSPISISDIRLE